jgi:hypothetical protein
VVSDIQDMNIKSLGHGLPTAQKLDLDSNRTIHVATTGDLERLQKQAKAGVAQADAFLQSDLVSGRFRDARFKMLVGVLAAVPTCGLSLLITARGVQEAVEAGQAKSNAAKTVTAGRETIRALDLLIQQKSAKG